jgi:hypothetical protein
MNELKLKDLDKVKKSNDLADFTDELIYSKIRFSSTERISLIKVNWLKGRKKEMRI